MIYRKGLRLILKDKKKKVYMKTKGTFNWMRQNRSMWHRKHVQRKEKEENKRNVPQTQAH